MKKCTNKWNCPFLYALVLQGIFMVLGLTFSCNGFSAEEMYIITTKKGLEIIVKDYAFTDEYVEFTTPNDLPGFIRREEFVKIANMVGVPPAAEIPVETTNNQKEREIIVWLAVAAVLFVLYIVFLVYVTRKKKRKGGGEVDVYYGRREKEPVTQGHLAFQYRQTLGRSTDWVIEVRNAYEEDGILFIEGIVTGTGKRKTFRADRVNGLVTDVSSGHKASIDKFFTDADGQEE
jgi:hypothetical protein